jgi:hypothetical protein
MGTTLVGQVNVHIFSQRQRGHATSLAMDQIESIPDQREANIAP